MTLRWRLYFILVEQLENKKVCSGVVFVLFLSTCHKLGSPGKREPQQIKCLHQIRLSLPWVPALTSHPNGLSDEINAFLSKVMVFYQGNRK